MIPIKVKSGSFKNLFSRKGVSVTAFLSPSLLALLALHVIIVGLIVEVNGFSSTLSALMQRSAVYVTNATSLLAGSSVLSDTATNYVLRPLLPDSSPNLGPIRAYSSELLNPRRPDDVLKKFENTEAPKNAVAQLDIAASHARILYSTQLYAIALISSVHELPNIPEVEPLRKVLPALSEDEVPVSERADKAADLLLDKSYGDSKGMVSSSVNAAVAIIQEVSGKEAARASERLNSLRYWLWGTAVGIMVLIIFIFFMLYRFLILPVMRSSKLIENGEELMEKRGFREMRVLSSAYNGLKARRDSLDQALRLAAERDALTGLANRYAYDHCLGELSHTDLAHDSSLAFCLFDVNYLKETNDSHGHAAGDGLLKEASYCIEQCFKGGKHFRIGGDEFACILLGVNEEKVREMMDAFVAAQKEKKISVSYGYSYAPSIVEDNVEALMKKADDAMYARKEEMHKKGI